MDDDSQVPAHMDRSERRTRLYVFPGGVFEIEESPGQEPGVGIRVETRFSSSDAEDSELEETGLRLVDDGPDTA